MHKIFAKPLFLGKKAVFLPQCHSTNEELSHLVHASNEPEGMVLYTDYQQRGKGQRGNGWVSERGKNVLMSVFLKPTFLSPQQQFFLNLISGLAVVDVIKRVAKKEAVLKWPNDVYVNEQKITGILVESNLLGNKIVQAIVGIGLNVNQAGFNVPNATSLFLETGEKYDRESVVMEYVLLYLEKWYKSLKSGNYAAILNEYHKLLMWRGELRSFSAEGREFQGEIVGIDASGRLAMNVSGHLKYFNIKEVKFLG